MVKKNSSLIIVTKIPRVNETIFIIEKFGVLFLVIYVACIIRKGLDILGINIRARLLIFEVFSRGYVLIKGGYVY